MTKLRIALGMGWSIKESGDHGMAQSWAKYLRRRDDVAEASVVHPGGTLPPVDCVVHFHHWTSRVPNARNILYLQNAWPVGMELQDAQGRLRKFNGTVDVFNAWKERFDAFLFPSAGLAQACDTQGKAKAVIPFACDPERFNYTPDVRFEFPVVFCGADIRGAEANEKYLVPAIRHGLTIFGNGPWADPRLNACWRGRLSDDDLVKCFSSAKVNLDVTIPEHSRYGLINQRIYEILACGGTLLSDNKSFIDGNADKTIEQLLQCPATEPLRDHRRASVLAGDTFANRVDVLMKWLKEIL